VNGLRSETETIEKMRERVRFDLQSLSHWSPGFSIEIIFESLQVLGRDKKAR